MPGRAASQARWTVCGSTGHSRGWNCNPLGYSWRPQPRKVLSTPLASFLLHLVRAGTRWNVNKTRGPILRKRLAMPKPTILVVDDKKNMLSLMTKLLKDDARVLTADCGAEALRLLSAEPVAAVLCDLKMPDMDGLEVLRACNKLRPNAQFILMTAYASLGTAVEALRLGAYDYLTKPFEPHDAKALLLQATQRGDLSEDAEKAPSSQTLPGVVACSAQMGAVSQLVSKVADREITALILGETGTGKEKIARAIHEMSPRRHARFVAVNCAAIPPDLLESELFGHARGSFTGAVSNRKGLFEEAEGGSLFLDEIGDMLPSLQAKMTRVLEERTIRRVGESQERPINVRLIAATHRDLSEMVKAETFREDLWYRLNVALIQLPPLRERKDDIELLAKHFLRDLAVKTANKRTREFSSQAMSALRSYDWPGNVRQLRAVVERAHVLASDAVIELKDLSPEVLRAEYGDTEDPKLTSGTWTEACEWGRFEIGRRYLVAVLRHYSGNVAQAAKHAGVERESFYRLMRKHELDPTRFRDE